MYKIAYLPLALHDLLSIVKYIKEKLHNPQAAEDLAEEIVAKIENLKDFPYANRVYLPLKELKQEYRRMVVKNYLIFYWVDEENKTVTVARVIYSRRDYLEELK